MRDRRRADTLAGQQVEQQLGQVVSPDDAYLASRGLRTLAVRMKAHEAAALELARKGSGYAVAALCGAGGQGDALILRRP